MDNKKILVTAEMGFGHLRALYPFANNPDFEFFVLGQTDGSSKFEKRLWKFSLNSYEWASRFKRVPIIGAIIYWLMNGLLSIPNRNKKISKVEYSLPYQLLELIIKLGLCKNLINSTKSKAVVLTSFYAPVVALSKKKVSVFCQICDADLSRVWVSRKKSISTTHYFAPCKKAANRLLLYSVNPNNIHLTGFPLPKKLIGESSENVATQNYLKRKKYLSIPHQISSNSPLEIAYIVGGAGAYSKIGKEIALSFRDEINKGTVVLYLVAGIKKSIIDDYNAFIEKEFSESHSIRLVYGVDQNDYFNKFTDLMANIHIIWTKPSEIVFYSALGIPIIMTDPLGPQEKANREWLIESGAGIDQYLSKHTNLWVINRLNKGIFYEMTCNGWENGIRSATYKIPEIISQNML